MATKLKTPEQVKKGFRERGETLKAWAKENKFNYQAVLRVLGGAPATRGKSHDIAVALGMKPKQENTDQAA